MIRLYDHLTWLSGDKKFPEIPKYLFGLVTLPFPLQRKSKDCFNNVVFSSIYHGGNVRLSNIKENPRGKTFFVIFTIAVGFPSSVFVFVYSRLTLALYTTTKFQQNIK